MRGFNWPVISFLAIVYLVLSDFSFSKLTEVEVGSAGNVVDNVDDLPSNPNQFTANFKNDDLDNTIYLYWVNPDNGASVYMNEITAGGLATITTTIGHVFYATTQMNGKARLEPHQVRIKQSVNQYSFKPSSSSHTQSASTGQFITPSSSSAKTQISKNPHVKLLNTPSSACSAKFRSLIPGTIDIFYEDGKGGLPQGTLGLGKEYTVNTYHGHVFYFTEKGNKSKEIARFTMDKNKVLYLIKDEARDVPAALLQQQANEEAFSADYLNRTGIQWRHFYGPEGPRPPPTLYMWAADHVGQTHTIRDTEGHWHCKGSAETCQSAPTTLKMEVISQAPRAFIIPNFLSEFEADEIIRIAEPKKAGSTVGSKDGGGTRSSDTRTSRNAWVGRDVNFATESLFRRAEQLLRVDRLDQRNTEDMQVVHYQDGQKYDAHHDWGVSGYVESRYITLLMYLTDMASPTAGGETSFPKAAGGKGIKVHPGKGSAVMFYNLLEDGNGDDLSLHAALPVNEGEKWLANFWVWDPKRK